MSRNSRFVRGAMAFAASLTAAVCSASVPALINYQGRVSAPNGVPLSGAQLMRFTLYSLPTGGAPVWQEPPASNSTDEIVVCTQGMFNVLLGGFDTVNNALPPSAFTGVTYLEIKVNGQAMMPRMQSLSAGYSFRAQTAESVSPGSVGTSGLANGAVTTAKISGSGGAAGQVLSTNGTSTSWANDGIKLPYVAAITTTTPVITVTNTAGEAFEGQPLNPAPRRYTASTALARRQALSLGENTGKGTGVTGSTQTALASGTAGVYGSNTLGIGVKGTAQSGEGVHGEATSTGTGVYGYNASTGRAGQFVINNSSNGVQAVDAVSNGSGVAVKGYMTGTGGAGFFSIANAANSSDALYAGTNGTGAAAFLDGDARVSKSLTVDLNGTNTGALSPGLVFQYGSGEGIASNRSAGANQYGLDLYTAFSPRLSISNSGVVTIPNSLTVGGQTQHAWFRLGSGGLLVTSSGTDVFIDSSGAIKVHAGSCRR